MYPTRCIFLFLQSYVFLCYLKYVVGDYFQPMPCSSAQMLLPFRNNCFLCFYCYAQSKRVTLLSERNKEETYISKGFHSWKKPLKCFNDHQKSNCHKAAASYHAIHSNDIGDLVNKNLADSRKDNRSYLITVIRGLRYLARQGIGIQRTHDPDSFTHLLRLLGTKDPLVIEKMQRSSLKFTPSDVQNEVLDIMAKQVLPTKVAEKRKK